MFSIIIPLFNKAPYIQRAIDSVLNQSFLEYEIIVVNDGSTDGGNELVKNIYGDKVTLINQKNLGVSVARNNGIAKAQYPWIAFLDADDYWHQDYLFFVSTVIKENKEIGIIGCHYDPQHLSSNPILKYIKLDNYFKRAVKNVLFFTSATVLKKDFFDQNAGFDPQLKLGEDIDVWLRASLFFGDGIYIQNTLVGYGQDDQHRATQKSYFLDQTLISKLIQKNYYNNSILNSNCSQASFEKFRDKWIYLSLFQHYDLNSNLHPIRKLIKMLRNRFFLVRSFYLLPSRLLQVLFNNQSFSKLFRNYLKFCFRFIYT
ncbi:glycosyltransferase family 2 protein [Belliella pelovolcani]|uniref:glycosyltransferase family 2 protein n=1 Tax=Belliella pelovolcani TaxID=529505 RepID=UPI00391D43F1